MSSSETIRFVSHILETFPKQHPEIKAIFLYGSAVRKGEKAHDIDVCIIVDDTKENYREEALERIKRDCELLSMLVERKYGLELHFQEPKPLSHWWDMLRSGEPWVITAMKDAHVVYDPSDFIKPLQNLLLKGRLAGTREKAFSLMERSSQRIREVKRMLAEEVLTQILETMVEVSQAVLMFCEVAPPPASAIGEELRKWFVGSGLVEGRVVEYYEDFYEFVERVSHREVTRVRGKDVKKYLERAILFVREMSSLFEKLEKKKKEEYIRRSYSELKSILGENLKVKKLDREVILEFKKVFVDTGKVSPKYLDILAKVVEMKELVRKNRVDEIPERDVYTSMIYVRNLREILRKGGEREQEKA